MKHYLFLHWQSAKTALAKIIRQPFGSFLSMLMLSLALSLPLFLYVISSSMQSWASQLNAEPQITMFVGDSASSSDLVQLKNQLKQQIQIKNYVFVSKHQALDKLAQRNGIDNVKDLIGGLDKNPLPDAFIVTPKSVNPQDIQKLQHFLSKLPNVESAKFDAAWAQRLFEVINFSKRLVWFLFAVLGIALILIIYNTIRMQILARKEEIEISKLIGATDSFIRRPFLYYAFWQGLFSAIIAYSISCYLASAAYPSIKAITNLYGEQFNLLGLNIEGFLLLLICSIFFAISGACLAVNYHLRQINKS